jgi:hypothetical protein
MKLFGMNILSGKKRWFGLLLGLLLFGNSNAQLRFNFTSAGNPPAELAAWQNQRQLGIVTILPGSANFRQVKVKVQLKLNGEVSVETDLKKARPVTLEQGAVTTLFAEDIYPFISFTLLGKNATSISKTGKLLAGNYEVCVRLYDIEGIRALSEEVCKPFIITAYQPPTLLLPQNEAMVTRGQRPLFRWTPLVPKPAYPVTYRIQVFEVLPGQTPIQAYRVNRPIIDRDILAITQLLWPPDFDQPKDGQKYIWNVQGLDREGKVIGENEGRGEPFIFTMGTGIGQPPLDTLVKKCACKQWEFIGMAKPNDPVVSKIDCKQNYTVPCNTPFTFSFNYICSPANCKAGFTVKMTDPAGNTTILPVVNPSAFPFTFSMTGTYSMTIIPNCGGKECEACTITFKTTCPTETDCCKNFIRDIVDKTPVIAASGNQLILGSQFFTGSPVTQIDASVVSIQSTINCNGTPPSVTNTALPAVISSGSCTGGLATTAIPYQDMILFTGAPATNPSVSLTLNIGNPPSSTSCSQTIKVCVRYLLQYKSNNVCRSCEVIRCYTITRSGGTQ